MIQLERGEFDITNQTTSKNHNCLRFDSRISLDRYTTDKQPAIFLRQKAIKDQKLELRMLESKLEQLLNYNDLQLPISSCLKASIQFLEENGGGSSAVGELQAALNAVENEIENLKLEQEGLKSKIEKAYEDWQDYPYVLHSVMVHEGAFASAGHYWSFIRIAEDAEDVHSNDASPTWWKCNDTQVTRVSDAQMKDESFGGLGQTCSAYSLIYVKEDTWNEWRKEEQWQPEIMASLLPPHLVEELELDNMKFEQEKHTWQKLNFV